MRKPRGKALSASEKHVTRRLAKLRIRVEHVVCWLKRFRILKDVIATAVSGLAYVPG